MDLLLLVLKSALLCTVALRWMQYEEKMGKGRESLRPGHRPQVICNIFVVSISFVSFSYRIKMGKLKITSTEIIFDVDVLRCGNLKITSIKNIALFGRISPHL